MHRRLALHCSVVIVAASRVVDASTVVVVAFGAIVVDAAVEFVEFVVVIAAVVAVVVVAVEVSDSDAGHLDWLVGKLAIAGDTD